MFFVRVHAAFPEEEVDEDEEEVEREAKSGVKVKVKVKASHGDVHLYRKIAPHLHGTLPAHRSEHVCVLAVPNRMTMAAFCDFIGSSMENIREVHVVRNDSQMDRYSVLIDFSNQNSADEFYLQFNGRLFFSPAAEVCHVLFTENIEFTESGDEAALTPIGLTELPTCPVCLERLDEDISGIVMTSSSSSSGSTCISEWEASCCPVCISCQQHADQSVCSVCYTLENLWICVICGFVGCGRYQSGHAIKHWKETQHCYSLELMSQRVWDYVGDGYVHRLIQSKMDGKVVELSTTYQDENNDCGKCECSDMSTIEEALFDSKMDAIAQEYNDLLKNQLESQRLYFDGLLVEAREQRDASIAEAVEKAVNLKMQKLQARFEKVEKEVLFLEQINASMMANQEGWKKKAEDAEDRESKATKQRDDQIAALEEQVRQCMVLIEAQQTPECSSSAEIRNGTIMALPTDSTTKKASRSSKGGRKRV